MITKPHNDMKIVSEPYSNLKAEFSGGIIIKGSTEHKVYFEAGEPISEEILQQYARLLSQQ